MAVATKDKPAKDTPAGVEAQLERIARGDQVEAGYCIDFSRRPHVYKCTEEDEAVARGDISRSFDGQTITSLADGQVIRGDDRGGFTGAAATTPATTDNVPPT